MCKKLFCLMSLVLVLCLAGSAGAATWIGFGDGSSWNDVDNWDTTALPDSVNRVNTVISGTVVINGYAAYAYKGQGEDVTLDIINGGSLTIVDTGAGTAYYSGDFTAGGGSYWTVGASSLLSIDQFFLGYNGQSTLDVYGTVSVNRPVGSGAALVFGAKTGANGQLNIYAGGTLDTTQWDGTDSRDGTGAVDMYGGSIIIDGEITSGPVGIPITFHGGPGVFTYLGTAVDRTVITVPEPTTVALLGLGGLALLRKRR